MDDDMTMFDCLDCGVNTADTHEYYMVKNKVWRKAHPEDEGMLCISCLETRLGRVLRHKDFTDAPINDTVGGWPQSDRLVLRLNDRTNGYPRKG